MKAELTLKTAREMYNQGGAAKLFALDNYTEEELTKKELPSSWEELEKIQGFYIGDTNSNVIEYVEDGIIDDINKNVFPTKELAEASLALAQLLQLRDRYNDGWVADWSDSSCKKYVIHFNNKLIITSVYYTLQRVLNFKTKELRNLFLENFRDLIKTAKPLL